MSRSARPRSQLARRSSGELIADHLRRQIIHGELGPGQRLAQEDIAARLGTSRVPVREALVILEQEGWIKMEMHRGGFVLPIETSVGDNAEVWVSSQKSDGGIGRDNATNARTRYKGTRQCTTMYP